MTCFLRLLLLSTLFISLSLSEAKAAKPRDILHPGFEVKEIRSRVGKKDKKKFICSSPPPPAHDLIFDSIYLKGDKTHSIVDVQAEADYKRTYAPLATFEKKLARMANRYVRSSPSREDIAACVADWIIAWAQQDALLGTATGTGEFVRKWILASVANTWLQIQDSPYLSNEKRNQALEWIQAVAYKSKQNFDRHPENASRQNNHLYWAAWAVASAAVVLNDDSLFKWALEKAKYGLLQIQADGSLPLEMSRGKRAYLYHLYAAMPLFFLAELASKNGDDLFSFHHDALYRLAQLNLRNLGTGDDFAHWTGKKQDMDRVGTASDLAWIEIYHRHYQDDIIAQETLNHFRPMQATRIGGDATLLYGQDYSKQKNAE